MLIVVVYDLSSEYASKVTKLCCKYGQRVQNSVFECQLDWSQYLELKAKLAYLIDKKQDSIIVYNLGNNFKDKIDIIGKQKTIYKQEDILII